MQQSEAIAWERAFAKLKADADKIRAREKEILDDYKNNMSVCEIAHKHHVVGPYVEAVIRYYLLGVKK